MRHTLMSRSPSFEGASGEFYHPEKKRVIKAKTISCIRQADGRYKIVVDSFEIEDLKDMFNACVNKYIEE